ncbi:Uncharacterized protein TCM_027432 [Theobroma cacao]|uniref:Uncharacterized protein n=1 Tax=Theobroma cacao TaxID=3641 RepID=A0A061G843_THECC|nr:Uncharacterized protein TCM_027432 [Theobroma cacao]
MHPALTLPHQQQTNQLLLLLTGGQEPAFNSPNRRPNNPAFTSPNRRQKPAFNSPNRRQTTQLLLLLTGGKKPAFLWCRASRRSTLSSSVRCSFPSRQIFAAAAPFLSGAAPAAAPLSLPPFDAPSSCAGSRMPLPLFSIFLPNSLSLFFWFSGCFSLLRKLPPCCRFSPSHLYPISGLWRGRSTTALSLGTQGQVPLTCQTRIFRVWQVREVPGRVRPHPASPASCVALMMEAQVSNALPSDFRVTRPANLYLLEFECWLETLIGCREAEFALVSKHSDVHCLVLRILNVSESCW